MLFEGLLLQGKGKFHDAGQRREDVFGLYFEGQVIDCADAQLFWRQFAGDDLAPVLDASISEEAIEPGEVPAVFGGGGEAEGGLVVVGGEGRAVAPYLSWPQVECPDLAVFGDLPAFGGCRDHVEILVEGDERILEEVGEAVAVVDGDREVEGRGALIDVRGYAVDLLLVGAGIGGELLSVDGDTGCRRFSHFLRRRCGGGRRGYTGLHKQPEEEEDRNAIGGKAYFSEVLRCHSCLLSVDGSR